MQETRCVRLSSTVEIENHVDRPGTCSTLAWRLTLLTIARGFGCHVTTNRPIGELARSAHDVMHVSIIMSDGFCWKHSKYQADQLYICVGDSQDFPLSSIAVDMELRCALRLRWPNRKREWTRRKETIATLTRHCDNLTRSIDIGTHMSPDSEIGSSKQCALQSCYTPSSIY